LTATSLPTAIDRLGTLSHTLANATPPGFRRDVAVARGGFDARLSSELDRTQGAMRYSANALDVALESDGFFVLQSAAGPMLTRHGALHLDPSGRLVGPNGGAVLGTSGEIVLSQPEPRIDQAGNVWDGDKLAGQIRIVRAPADGSMVSLGNGMYASDSGALQDIETPRLRQGYVE